MRPTRTRSPTWAGRAGAAGAAGAATPPSASAAQAVFDRIQRGPCVGAGAAALAGRDQACCGPLCLRRHRLGSRLQAAHHGVDLATGFPQPLLDLLIELPAERFLAVLQIVFAGLELRGRVGEGLPLARGEPPLVLERLHVALHARQVIGELALALAAVRPRALDDRGGKPETVRDLEREAAARASRSSAGRSARTSSDRTRIPPASRLRSSTHRSSARRSASWRSLWRSAAGNAR